MTPKLFIPVLVATSMLATALVSNALTDSDGASSPILHSVSYAQTADTPTPVPTFEPPSGVQVFAPIEGKLYEHEYPKLDSTLNRIAKNVETGQLGAQAAARSAPIHQGQSVAVTLYIIEGYADIIAGYLEANGASPRHIGSDYIEAYIPVSLLPAASQQEGVLSIQTIIPPEPAQGTVVSKGAEAHGAPAWHAAGLKGRGVKVGVIDVSFKGFETLMGSELPATVQARCYSRDGVLSTDIADCVDEVTSSSHGTATTEVVFDIAPEATYYIGQPKSNGDLREIVIWMVSQGVQVINMSIAWGFDGPGDGTSPFSNSPLRTVDTGVSGGIVWTSPTGNFAQRTWFGAFRDENGNGFHEFTTTGDECNGMYIRSGLSARLRWDGAWDGASSDLDLYLVPVTDDAIDLSDAVASSEGKQEGEPHHYPREIIGLGDGDIAEGEYCIAVHAPDNAAPSWIQLRALSGSANLERNTLSHSVASPAESANPGLLAVGAAPWSDTSTIEAFSSRGPTTDGRIKPEVVGADGARTKTYGVSYGTSQAAPHVAGLAALVRQRYPSYTPQQVADYLKANAAPRGTVPNNTWGYGFAQLPASDATLSTPTHTPTATHTPVPTATHTPVPTATHTPVPTATHTHTSTATHTPTATATHTPVPTATHTHTPTATHTPVPTATHTPVPTATHTHTPTATHTPVPTATHTPVPTATHTPTATATHTPVPTATHTATATPIPSATHTPVPTATHTHTVTATHTPVPTATHTQTATATPIPSATHTPVPTATHTHTPTRTPVPTATLTHTPTATHTPVPTVTPTHTTTATATYTPLPTATHTHTPTGTPVPTATLTHTPTATPTPDDALISSTPEPTATHTSTATPGPRRRALPPPPPEPTATPTPAPPDAPNNWQDRLNAIADIIAVLQRLLEAMESRVAALEEASSMPTATPAPALVAPTPTATPTPTPALVAPTPTATPTPTHTHTPTPTPA